MFFDMTDKDVAQKIADLEEQIAYLKAGVEKEK